MQNIGYIVSKHKVKDILDGIDFVSNYEDVPKGFPYLIIGLNEAKKTVSNFSILNHKIDELGRWTFGKTERRNDYERDINAFYHNVVSNIIKKIDYYYINILTIPYSKFKKLREIINSDERKYIYISSDMIYIYARGYVMGISLQLIKYCGIDENKVILRLTKNKNNVVSRNDSFLSLRMKNMIKNNKYLLPYFMSLQ